MYQFNEQFTAATRQFGETASQVGQLALENAEKVFGLQLSTLEANANATFAFLGEIAEVRDLDGYKAVLPKGVQVARENVERSIHAGQEVFARTLKTNEAIGQIAKGQVEAATEQAQADTAKAAKAAGKKA
ncbi:phasin family protein [Luteimonas salinilitoris]|uniref:Phasin family protein n=1 Tax=Luteimonas salinilitoris TaxID=3237697 RepID=A0ABV4HS28_9GAMM